MKITKFILLFYIFVGCNSGGKSIQVSEFDWMLTIPKVLKEIPVKTTALRQEGGIRMIEDAYPGEKIKIIAEPIINYSYGTYNKISAQYTNFESNKDFLLEFERANEILINSILNRKPELKYTTEVGTIKIDNLEFKTFELNTLNNTDNPYKFSVYSRMFGNKKLDIIILSDDEQKRDLFERILKNSKFKN